MKILLYLLTLAASSAIFPREYYPWKRTQLTAVTNFEDFESFYLTDMRRQRSKSLQAQREYPRVTIEVKKTICNKILGHHHRVAEEFWLNLDVGNVRYDLKNENRVVYEEIFMHRRRNSAFRGSGWRIRPLKRKYWNPYVEMNAIVKGKTVTEYVFKCLARKRHGGRLVQYYVSEEYNVNILREKTGNIEPKYIAGRFVFFQDPEERWQLLEMAEESAILSPPEGESYERMYVKYRRNQREIAATPDDDPVCSLSPALKLRLCVSMMNTTQLTGRSKTPQFVPIYNNFRPETQGVDLECKKRHVEFSTEINRKYEEWTISCHVGTRHETTERFIIARGYKMNSIFAFELLPNNNIRVDYHCVNVSVVNDQTIQTREEGPEHITF